MNLKSSCLIPEVIELVIFLECAMASRIAKFRLVRCPKCFKLLSEFTDISVNQCDACSNFLRAKGCSVTGESNTSRSGSNSICTLLNSSDQSVPFFSGFSSYPSSNAESSLREKGVLSSTHADMDGTTQLFPDCKQDETIGKNKDILHEDVVTVNQLRKNQLTINDSISKDRLNILNLETSRSPNAYDASISSIEDDSTDHAHNKYRLLSRRTFRLRKVSESASNRSKEDDEATAETDNGLIKIQQKSSRGGNEIASKSGAEQAYGSLLMEPTYILNALASDKRDRIELLRKVDYARNQHRGVNDQIVERRSYHQSSSQKAHIAHRHCSMCSSCPYNNHCSSSNQEAEKLSIKEKRRQAKRHCRPMSNGAPFVICNECFKVLLLPLDFLVSKKSNKLQCGACLKVLALPFPAKDRIISGTVSYDKNCLQLALSCTKNCAVDYESVLLIKPGSSFQVRNCKQGLGLPLHQLMGYFSATELLYQVSDVDEGYESSEPAMPDSYRCYEERRKNFLLRHSGDEAHFDPVGFNEEEEEEGASPNKLNRKDLKPPHSLAKVIKRN